MKSLRTALILAALVLAVPATASAADPLISSAKPVTASSVYSTSYPASAAVDGNAATRWSSLFSDPQWIYVNLGATYNISRIRLNWEFAYGRAYKLQVSNDASTWTDVYSTTTGDGGFDDITGLAAQGRYVRMSGTVRGTQYGYSLWELEVYGTQPDTTPPTAPANLTASAGNAQATLQWTASTDNVGVTGYRVFRNGTQVAAAPTGTSYTDTGLTNGTTYTYTVRAADAAGNVSADSNSSSATPQAPVQDPLVSQGRPATASSQDSATNCCAPGLAVDGNTATRWSSTPADPSWIYVDLGQSYNVTRVKLTWEFAYGRSYKIQTSNDASTWTDIYSTTTGDGGTDDLTGLSGAGRYVRMYGTVRGTQYGYSLFEFQVYGQPTGGDTTNPTAPTLSGTAGNAQVSLSWSGATDNVGVTGYHVYRNGTQVGAPTGTSFTDTGLTNGTQYAYTVKANDAAGNLSPASNTVNLTPSAVGGTGPNGPPGTWALAWSDEFNGTSLDTSKWVCNGYNNNHMSGSDCADISEANGEVKLSPDPAGHGANMVSAPYDGATNGYTLPVGGVAEARVYFPGNPSNCNGGVYDWPAFWVSGPSWPSAGETDVAEDFNHGQLSINYHSLTNNKNGPDPAGCWANAFHTYTVWRQANQVQVYWDGVLQWTWATNDNGQGEALWFTQGYNADGTDVYGDAGAVRADYARVWVPG